MIVQLGGLPISDVVFGAGQVEDHWLQVNYELGIVARVREMCPGARVVWPVAPANDVWGCCYYLPLAEEVGFLQDNSEGFVGTGDREFGITHHWY